jgi:Glycosyltransferases, probably involved in cell wall biogenesis
MQFQVSVVVPVYNAALFVRSAVESAMHLPEVGEILLVDDGYPDGALEVCRQLEKEYDKVKVLQHLNGENRGAGASRNLGVRNAKYPFISFLDADDYYLENRFTDTKLIFESDNTIDGVYAPVGTRLAPGANPVFRQYTTREQIENHVSFTKRTIEPDALFSSLLRGKEGSFHTNGIVLRRELLNKTGLFNERLRLHQDYELWLRCAYHGKLVGVKSAAPVAIRVVHNENRIHSINLKSRSIYYEEVFRYFSHRKISIKDRWFLIVQFAMCHPDRKHISANPVSKYTELLALILKVSLAAVFKRQPED